VRITRPRPGRWIEDAAAREQGAGHHGDHRNARTSHGHPRIMPVLVDRVSRRTDAREGHFCSARWACRSVR
jgi:hypothetical protein